MKCTFKPPKSFVLMIQVWRWISANYFVKTMVCRRGNETKACIFFFPRFFWARYVWLHQQKVHHIAFKWTNSKEIPTMLTEQIFHRVTKKYLEITLKLYTATCQTAITMPNDFFVLYWHCCQHTLYNNPMTSWPSPQTLLQAVQWAILLGVLKSKPSHWLSIGSLHSIFVIT